MQTLAIIAGGAWAFWRYVYQGDFKRRVSFAVDVNFVTVHRDAWLVELVAKVDNKGLVSHKITSFEFKLRCINPEDGLEESTKANGQTDIPHKLKEGSWIPAGWENTFVRPGVCNTYTYVTTIPTQAVAAVLLGRFNYQGRDAFHTASKLVKVPQGTLLEMPADDEE